jgi:hypothetical protein
LKHATIWVEEGLNNQFETLSMRRNGYFFYELFASGLMLEIGSLLSDPRHNSFG